MRPAVGHRVRRFRRGGRELALELVRDHRGPRRPDRFAQAIGSSGEFVGHRSVAVEGSQQRDVLEQERQRPAVVVVAVRAQCVA